MRDKDNSKFTLYRSRIVTEFNGTHTQDWYLADEVDILLEDLLEAIAEVNSLLSDLKGK
jgi:hypothetical protein